MNRNKYLRLKYCIFSFVLISKKRDNYYLFMSEFRADHVYEQRYITYIESLIGK